MFGQFWLLVIWLLQNNDIIMVYDISCNFIKLFQIMFKDELHSIY